MDEERLAEIVEEQVEKSVSETSNKLLSDLDNMFSVRMGALQNDITVNQSVLATNQMVAINGLKLLQQPVFKKKGNQEQFKFNLRVQDAFEGVNSALEAPLTEMSLQKAKESSVKGIDLIKHRQKMIRLADQSDAGWSIVAEYESNELAEDSEDEKKIVKADARAVRKMKESRTKRSKRQTSGQGTAPYTTQRPSSNPVRFQATTGTRPPVRRGNCFGCGKPGHYRYECGAFAAVQNKISTNKISLTSICNNGVDGSTNLQTGDNRDSRAEVVDHGVNISPVGGLKQAYKVWEEAGAGVHILDVIEHGYKLPLYDTPPKSFCRNNKSAFDNSDFVASEIDNLLRKGCVSEVNEIPSIVNPLTVASNKLGKLRLVLDCRILNPFLLKFAFKLDDIQIAKQLFKCGDFLFTFDLKSAYHHIEIFPDHRTYLGFSWMQKGKVTYFVFNVLPFGVSTAAYIFTKLTRVFVAYLRGDGLDVAMYMDDGCGGARTLEEANMMRSRVRHDLVKFGLLIAEDKCIWVPNQKVTWLGHVLSMGDGMVFVTNARIKSLLDCLERMIRDIASGLNGVSVRTLAAIVGKIISMHMAIGPLVRLKTRFTYSCIELRANWDSQVLIDSNAFSELTFWSENVCALNGRSLYDKVVCNAVAFSDASATGFGGYLVANNEAEVTGEWTDEESSQSSTWRELEAVARVLNANKSCLFHKSVKWFTDNQNVVSILKFGSKVAHLQDIALNVYDNCHEAGVHLEPVWIPRGLNERADVLSKGGDCDDWSLSVEAFASLDMAFGPHSVDRFASEYNCKCARFNSRWWSSNSEGVDAFAQSWANENNLLVPPPRLASQSLIKLEVENACGTLVIPEWRSAPYWPRLFKGRNILRTFVKGYIVLDTGLSIVKGRGKNGVFGKRNVPFSMLAVRVCFGKHDCCA